MKWDVWYESARQGWQHPFFRWMTVTTLLLIGMSTSYFFWKMVPARPHAQTFVLHYNVYLGIDSVGSWTWLATFPLIWFFITLIDMLLAFALYRTDVHLAYALMTFACAWSLPWAAALFFLTRVNV